MKRIAVILAILAIAISVKANYSIYDFTGHVVLIQGGRQIKPEKGMKVMPTDEIEIAPGAKVEIYNEKTKEIFASVSDGKKSVMGIMLDARRQASKTTGAINDRMRFSNSGGETDTRLYTEGLVKRSMQVYDPGAESLVVEPRALALHVAKTIISPDASDTIDFPAPIFHGRLGDSGKQFRLVNDRPFPVYLNVIKIKETDLGNVDISELGQPMGCYVVLPGQAIAREHFSGLKPDESHIMIMTNCRFDIDELIEQINQLIAAPSDEKPDTNLPVYLLRL